MKRLTIFLCIVGCSLKVPTVSEQAELVRKGAFPGGTPPWIASAALGQTQGERLSSGLIPEFYSAPRPGPQSSTRARLRGDVSDKAPQEDAKELSPLERVEAACPDLENNRVNDALITTDSQVRRVKFELLTKQCQQSADLWYWLAKEQARDGDIAAAKRSLNQSLTLSPDLEVARQLRSELSN